MRKNVKPQKMKSRDHKYQTLPFEGTGRNKRLNLIYDTTIALGKEPIRNVAPSEDDHILVKTLIKVLIKFKGILKTPQ